MSESAGRVPLRLPGRGGTRLANDTSLARRAAAGDEGAFAAIYKRHHQELYRYCRAILRDPDDAQDALQATMVKALRALPGETRDIALKPWLFRIAHNESISIIRARDSAGTLDVETPDPLAAPDQQAATHERLRQLVHDLDQLPERQRGALVMRELSGLSFEEVGRVFGFSAAAAKQAVYEARVGLQEMTEGRDMECDRVKEAISGNDRRVLRGRRIRAHLRGCQRCSDFDSAISARQADLAALAPPIAVPAAAATLQAVLGGSAAGSAALGAGAVGGGLAGGAALKTAAAVLATAALAGGTAELTGVVDFGGSPKSDTTPASAPADPAPESAPAGGEAGATDGTAGPDAAQAGRHRGGANAGQGRDHRNGGGKGRGDGQAAAPGQDGTAPGQAGTAGSSASAPGQTGSTPGQSGTAGNSASAPGQTGSTPGQSGTAGASANASEAGQAQSSAAGSNASATGQAHGGGTTTAPGRNETSPGQAGTAGSSAEARDPDDDGG